MPFRPVSSRSRKTGPQFAKARLLNSPRLSDSWSRGDLTGNLAQREAVYADARRAIRGVGRDLPIKEYSQLTATAFSTPVADPHTAVPRAHILTDTADRRDAFSSASPCERPQDGRFLSTSK